MPDSKPQKIVYLFGAGATHAEKQLECKIKKKDLENNGEPKNGLLAKHISERVIKKLLKKKEGVNALKEHEITKDSLYNNPLGKPDIDIELFISLLEANNTETAENHARLLRKYFREDICQNLVIEKSEIPPRLCPALLEWHAKDKNEKLIGFLSLNYDSIFEKSSKLTKKEFDCGIDVEEKSLCWPHKSGKLPLLKLHGSFDWYLSSDMDKMCITKKGTIEMMQWIPPRFNKEYLNYPYNIIHGKAYEILAQCDILRVIGCGLNQNDIGLISLLFETQHKGSNPYRIDMVEKSDNEKGLYKRLGMLLTFNEFFYNKDEWKKLDKSPTNNPFLDWLYFKVKNAPGNYLHGSKYLKNVEKWAKL